MQQTSPQALQYAGNPNEISQQHGAGARVTQRPQQPTGRRGQWKNTIDAMIRSEDPRLQKRGQAMFDQYISTPERAGSGLSPIDQKLVAMGLTPGTIDGYKMARRLALKSGITINTGSQSERTAEAYRSRMLNASKIMEEHGLHEDDPNKVAFIVDELVNEIPFFGNYFKTPRGQMRHALEKDWIMANARDESGATINITEWEKYRDTYFPVAFDKPEAVKIKARLRQQTEEAMGTKAGAAKGTTEITSESRLPEGMVEMVTRDGVDYYYDKDGNEYK
jgi:hypothetical protein